MTTDPQTDRNHRADLTVTVTSRPDGGHYFDRQDFSAHVVGWLKAGLKGRHAIAEVTVTEATPVSPAPALSDMDRQFLTFALELAADEMASRGDEFGDDDKAALETLRRLAAETQPNPEAIGLPRLFHLQRDIDISGVSGTGRVADGVLWPDDTVSIRWRGDRPSTVSWDHLADAEAVHGHGGATRIVWADEAQS